MSKQKYKKIKCENHPRADINGFIPEHIQVAEQTLNRYITPTEAVHHINRDKKDNRPENLIVFHTNSDHLAFHWSNMDTSLLTKLSDGSYTCKKASCRSNECRCRVCGKYIKGGRQLCQECLDRVVYVFGSYKDKEKQNNIDRNAFINLTGKQLYTENEKQMLANIVGAKVRNKVSKRISIINTYLESEYELDYVVESKRCKARTSEYYDKTYWIVKRKT